MAKTVIYDALSLGGGNLWVDPASGDIRLEVHFTLSSASGEQVSKSRQVQALLTPADRAAILDITVRLKTTLEAEELA